MKTSNYNFCYELEDGKELIYNTRSNALAVLDAQHVKKYKEFLQTGELSDTAFEDNLEKGGYIIQEDVSELELLRNQMLNSRYNSSTMALTIAVTADCNFRCVYCYEKDSIKTSKMTVKTQDAILEFVKKQVKNLSNLQISWYGGEPLLAFDVIEYLSPKFIKICEDNDIVYNAFIVTNGFLLTPEKAAILKKFNVSSIQVTLDGPEEIHNKRRPLAGGQGTFKKIVSNLKDCIDFFNNVNIRINTDNVNMAYINEVIDTLRENGIIKNNVGIYLGYVEDHNDAYDLSKCLRIDQFCAVNLKFIQDNHFNIMSLYPRLVSNFCCADCVNTSIIDSEGYLYKCWNDVGVIERNIGHILDDFENAEDKELRRPNVRRYLDYIMYDPTSDPKCVECKFLPICMGGCPYKRLRTNDDSRCINEKFMIDDYIKECAYALMRLKSEKDEKN